jgi:GNAT superfamily N-acetyltransferase
MLTRPARTTDPVGPAPWQIERWHEPDVDGYRRLYRAVGENWLWVSRLVCADEALRSTLHDPRVEVYVLRTGDRDVGLLELDLRIEGACELVYFGLVPAAIGTGAGRWLMDRAIALAWRHPIERFWMHTCHFDHPHALGFYRRSGFKPYATMVEVFDDPRLTGVLPRSAALHVPLIEE